MKTILVLGAGLSASTLIRYLLNNSVKHDWTVRIVDQDLNTVKKKINGHVNGVALSFNALNPDERRPEIQKADLVISMLPARFHTEVALDCIDFKTNLITPSYVSDEMKELSKAVEESGILILNEVGVDPGIDHMSAMQVIDQFVYKAGATIGVPAQIEMGYLSKKGGLSLMLTGNWNFREPYYGALLCYTRKLSLK